LLRNASVCSRIAELKQLVCNKATENFVQLAITERDQRLTALRDRWDRLREAIVARAAGDNKRMMATGVVCMRLKSVRNDKGTRVYREYEIDTGVVEALNSVERRAAIETGQEVDRQDIRVNGKLNERQEMLARAYADNPQELEAMLEAMRARMLAVAEAEGRGQVIGAPVDEKEKSATSIIRIFFGADEGWTAGLLLA
jgi:hypothetical protein